MTNPEGPSDAPQLEVPQTHDQWLRFFNHHSRLVDTMDESEMPDVPIEEGEGMKKVLSYVVSDLRNVLVIENILIEREEEGQDDPEYEFGFDFTLSASHQEEVTNLMSEVAQVRLKDIAERGVGAVTSELEQRCMKEIALIFWEHCPEVTSLAESVRREVIRRMREGNEEERLRLQKEVKAKGRADMREYVKEAHGLLDSLKSPDPEEDEPDEDDDEDGGISRLH